MPKNRQNTDDAKGAENRAGLFDDLLGPPQKDTPPVPFQMDIHVRILNRIKAVATMQGISAEELVFRAVVKYLNDNTGNDRFDWPFEPASGYGGGRQFR